MVSRFRENNLDVLCTSTYSESINVGFWEASDKLFDKELGATNFEIRVKAAATHQE